MQKFIQSSDLNQSGDVTLAEFIHYVREHEKKLQLVFASLDTDKDGRIKVHELIVAFRDLGVSITATEAQQLLKRSVFFFKCCSCIHLQFIISWSPIEIRLLFSFFFIYFRIDKDGSLDIGFSEWRDFLLFHPTTDLKEIFKFWRHSTVVLASVSAAGALSLEQQQQRRYSSYRWYLAMAARATTARTGFNNRLPPPPSPLPLQGVEHLQVKRVCSSRLLDTDSASRVENSPAFKKRPQVKLNASSTSSGQTDSKYAQLHKGKSRT